MINEAWSGILIYIQNRQGQIHSAAGELIGEALRLQNILHEKIYIAAVTKQAEYVIEQLNHYPIDEAFIYQMEESFQADVFEEPIIDCIRKLKPSIVLIGGTSEGRALAPRLAVEFKTGLTADCTELGIDENKNLVQIRPAFGGNIMAKIITENTRPQFATVRPGIFCPFVQTVSYHTIYHKISWTKQKSSIRILETQKYEQLHGITQQDILVVAGRGIKQKEDLAMLSKLAEVLGGGLASSRALVEKGWMSANEQIGLSGNTVCPKCMITFGVSGTVQFMAGMKLTPNIIAVNTDKNAGIFEIAHYPICADLYEVVPELLRLLAVPD